MRSTLNRRPPCPPSTDLDAREAALHDDPRQPSPVRITIVDDDQPRNRRGSQPPPRGAAATPATKSAATTAVIAHVVDARRAAPVPAPRGTPRADVVFGVWRADRRQLVRGGLAEGRWAIAHGAVSWRLLTVHAPRTSTSLGDKLAHSRERGFSKECGMTRRDLGVAVVTVACTLGRPRGRGRKGAADGDGTSAWDWASLRPPNKTGRSARCFGTDGDARRAGVPHHDAQSRRDAASPHKHPDGDPLPEGRHAEAIQDGKTIRTAPAR